MNSATIQVSSVFPGSFGGVIYRGISIGDHKVVTCKANWNVVTKIPTQSEFWEATGQFVEHPTFGMQLHVSSHRPITLPDSRYIGSVLVKHPLFRGFHFGANKVRNLISQIGTEKLSYLLDTHSVNELEQYVGISISRRLVDAWNFFNEEIKTFNYLAPFKFPIHIVYKLLTLTKRNIVDRIKSNPYALVPLSSGHYPIWRKIELCARRSGINLDNDFRLAGGIEFFLYRELMKGHTYANLSDVIDKTSEILKSQIRAQKGL